MKKISLNIPRDKFISTSIIAFLVAMCGYAVMYLYKNFYVSLAQVEKIEVLEKNVSKERLNKKLWDTVMQKRKEKLSEPAANAATTTPVRDPFTAE